MKSVRLGGTPINRAVFISSLSAVSSRQTSLEEYFLFDPVEISRSATTFDNFCAISGIVELYGSAKDYRSLLFIRRQIRLTDMTEIIEK